MAQTLVDFAAKSLVVFAEAKAALSDTEPTNAEIVECARILATKLNDEQFRVLVAQRAITLIERKASRLERKAATAT